MKALGTGVRGVGWRDIEVLPNRRGKPLVFLYGTGRRSAPKHIELRGLEISTDSLERDCDGLGRRRTGADGTRRHPAAGRKRPPAHARKGAAMKLVTAAQMRELEAAAVAAGSTEAQLMEEAGLAVAQEAWMMLGTLEGPAHRRPGGPGNNGGDGLVAARHLAEWGADADRLSAAGHRVEDAARRCPRSRNHRHRWPPGRGQSGSLVAALTAATWSSMRCSASVGKRPLEA